MPHRRRDDEHLLSYARRLVSGEHVLPLIRWVAFSYAVAFTVWGGSLIFFPDAKAYDNAVFDGIFRAAPPQTWGAAFWLVACLMIATAISARATVYLIAVALAAGFMAGWVFGVSAQTVVDADANLTGGAFALYLMAFTGLGATVFAKQTIEHQRQILERTPDGKVVPFVEADRRAG